MTRAKMRLLQFVLVTAAGAGALLGSEAGDPHHNGPIGFAGKRRHRTSVDAVELCRRSAPHHPACGRGRRSRRSGRGRPVVVAPSCVQMVDAYGRVYTRCP